MGKSNGARLKRVFAKQREAIRIMDETKKNTFLRMKDLKIVNIHKINLYQVLHFIFRVKNNIIPSSFNKKFQTIDHIYSTRHNQQKFVQSMIKYKQTKNKKSSRGQRTYLEEHTSNKSQSSNIRNRKNQGVTGFRE